MTELSPVCHVSPFDNIKYGSVGVLLPNLECKVSTMSAEENNFISLLCDFSRKARLFPCSEYGCGGGVSAATTRL